jgi:ribosomal protein L37AE/L43A
MDEKQSRAAMTDAALDAKIEATKPKTLKLMCGHCNRPVLANIIDGRIDGKCKKCGLRMTGGSKAWSRVYGASIAVMAPLGLHKRLTINLE